MKKVLIIGVKGMLGQELVRVFSADADYEVFGWDKLLMSDINTIDITDEAQVRDKVLKLSPAIIINAAAYNDVDRCEEPAEFALAKKLNGLAPGYLAKAAREIHNPPTPLCVRGAGDGDSLRRGGDDGAIFVHYSTDYVFDGQKEGGYKENDEPFPIQNYGISKLMGEQEVQKAGGQYYIIRLQKLFGWPAQSTSAKKSFFETMLFLARTKKKLEIVDEELANFTYAPDLAERTKWLVEISDSNTEQVRGFGRGLEKSSLTPLLQSGEPYPFGIYHIINEGAPMTWFGAAKVLFEMAQQRHPEPSAGGEGYLTNARPASAGDFSLRSRSVQNDKKENLHNDSIPQLTPVSSSKFSRPAKRPKYSILLNTKLPPLRPWPEALKEFLADRPL
ncbi:MAG: dTDP-4-dehydrorhamnose reductase [Parcubacteria group bacterium GW2011_GWA2_43_9b]|uniref:dTDP-4-dehydrorhamnose reductase n=1 Tax=Candidatus Portnoybacteria bacterium RIFCSPLOWO2_02_FULL_39_11 TaxID=1802001 RepID=A0A1G2FTN8_9BACT|nr:MAG: dTDP-4-dehydrorhamnose reductase [Parcubacteria group bacterium GW2011_GWA2_43_9b]OGZ40988.1 MAG: hypothetical protein A3B04_03400 [Candidatus Portnoybacteria bacterium RIFCSPLOWO2_02_FULL_39_11]